MAGHSSARGAFHPFDEGVGRQPARALAKRPKSISSYQLISKLKSSPRRLSIRSFSYGGRTHVHYASAIFWSRDLIAVAIAASYLSRSRIRKMNRSLESASFVHSVTPASEHWTRIGSNVNTASFPLSAREMIRPSRATVWPVAWKNPAVHQQAREFVPSRASNVSSFGPSR